MDQPTIKITYFENDAIEFVEIVDKLISKLLEYYRPKKIAVIRIKNWFDHKWLNYSGQKVEPLTKPKPLDPYIPFVLVPFWNDKITIPPFHPKRVLLESFYQFEGGSNPHFNRRFHIFQGSSENLNNSIAMRTKDALCLWISTNSEKNRKGSLMAYHIMGESVLTWYASIEEHGQWKIHLTKGISKEKLFEILAMP